MTWNFEIERYFLSWWWDRKFKVCLVGPDAAGKSVFYTLLTQRILDHSLGFSAKNSEAERIKIKYGNSSEKKTVYIDKLIDTPGQIQFESDRKKGGEISNVLVLMVKGNYFNDSYKVESDVELEQKDNHIESAKIIISSIDGWNKKHWNMRYRIKKLLVIGNHYSRKIYDAKVPFEKVSEVPRFHEKKVNSDYRNEFFKSFSSTTDKYTPSTVSIQYIVGSLSLPKYADVLVDSFCNSLN